MERAWYRKEFFYSISEIFIIFFFKKQSFVSKSANSYRKTSPNQTSKSLDNTLSLSSNTRAFSCFVIRE